MKNALGILLVIALVIIFLQNLCRKPIPSKSESTEKEIQLQQRIKDTAKFYQELLKSESSERAEAAAHSMQQRDQLEETNEKLNTMQAINNRLVAKIEGAKLERPDSTWVKVSPHYVSGCDSLTGRVVDLNNMIDQQQESGLKLAQLMSYEIAIRDSSLKAQKEFNRKFSNQLDDCMTQLHAKVNQKQRNQVYAGIGLLGNQINPIGGGQINVSYLTRGGQIYEITGATVGNVWYGGVGMKLLITFKK